MLICSYGEHVQHFKVLQDRGGQYYVWDELFTSLNELVEFYHSNSIAKERTVFLRDPEQFARVSKVFIIKDSSVFFFFKFDSQAFVLPVQHLWVFKWEHFLDEAENKLLFEELKPQLKRIILGQSSGWMEDVNERLSPFNFWCEAKRY